MKISITKKKFTSTSIDVEFTFADASEITKDTQVLCYFSNSNIESLEGLDGQQAQYLDQNNWKVSLPITQDVENKHFVLSFKISNVAGLNEILLNHIEFDYIGISPILIKKTFKNKTVKIDFTLDDIKQNVDVYTDNAALVPTYNSEKNIWSTTLTFELEETKNLFIQYTSDTDVIVSTIPITYKSLTVTTTTEPVKIGFGEIKLIFDAKDETGNGVIFDEVKTATAYLGDIKAVNCNSTNAIWTATSELIGNKAFYLKYVNGIDEVISNNTEITLTTIFQVLKKSYEPQKASFEFIINNESQNLETGTVKGYLSDSEIIDSEIVNLDASNETITIAEANYANEKWTIDFPINSIQKNKNILIVYTDLNQNITKTTINTGFYYYNNTIQFTKQAYHYNRYSNFAMIEFLATDAESGKPIVSSVTEKISEELTKGQPTITRKIETNNLICYYKNSPDTSEIISTNAIYNASKGVWAFTCYNKKRNVVVVKNAKNEELNGIYDYVSGSGWDRIYQKGSTNFKIKQYEAEGNKKYIWCLYDINTIILQSEENEERYKDAIPTILKSSSDSAFVWMQEQEIPNDYENILKVEQVKNEYIYSENSSINPSGIISYNIASKDQNFEIFSSEFFDENISDYKNKQNFTFLADSTSTTPDCSVFKREYISMANPDGFYTDKLYTTMSISDINKNKNTFIYNINNADFIVNDEIHQKAQLISFTKDFGADASKPIPRITDLIKGYDFSNFPVTDMILEYVKQGDTHNLYLYQALPIKSQKKIVEHPTFEYIGVTSRFNDDDYKIEKNESDIHRWDIFSRNQEDKKLKGILTDFDFKTEKVSNIVLKNGFILITAENETALNTAYKTFVSAYIESIKNDYTKDSYKEIENKNLFSAKDYIKGALIGDCLSATAYQRNYIYIPKTPIESRNQASKIGYVDYTGLNWTNHTKYQILIHGLAPARNKQYIESYINNGNNKNNVLKVSGDYLMCYFNKSTYLFDNMSVLSQQAISSNNIIGIPAFVPLIRTIYFPKPLEIVRKQPVIYIKDTKSKSDFRFSIKYNDADLPDYVTKELQFNTIWIANSIGDIGKEYSGTTHEYQDYPARLHNTTYYNTEDKYHHLLIDYGKPPELTPYGYVVTGLSGSKGQDSNGTYYYVSGSGWNRIFKHNSKEYYIRRYNEEYRWCITTTKEIVNYDNCIKRTNYNENYEENIPSIFDEWGSGDVSGNANLVYFDAEDENGKLKTFYMQFFDKYGNHAHYTNTNVEIYNIKPYDKYISIIGSSGQLDYTGFYKKHGRYFPSDYVTVDLSGRSKVELKYQITGDVVEESKWYNLTKTSEKYSHVVRIKPVNTNEKLLGNDTIVTIRVNFKDEAGNEGYIEGKIKFISKLYRTLNQNLLEESTDYNHSLFVVEGSTVSTLTKKRVSTTEFVRSWNEIYYPEEHGMPTNTDGSINEKEALRISNPTIDESKNTGPSSNELTLYDRLAITDRGTLETDSEGRFVQNMSAWTTTKKYPSNLNKLGINSTDSDYKYWIIDNTGNTEFKLEFEVFDLDGGVTKLPANYSAGSYDGDTVIVYDASAVGCTTSSIDENGNTVYTLVDSSKLKELFALKGSYLPTRNNPFRILGDNMVETLTIADSGFVTPSITSTSRICIMLYSDSQGEGSGFKIKAGPKHALEYSNYECNNEMGEFWIHISPNSINGQWKGCDELKINYKYYGSFATINREKATVKFDNRQDYIVTGTFTHYLYLNTDDSCDYPYGYFITESEKQNDREKRNCIHDFMLFNDDLVDYSEPSFYIAPNGVEPNKTNYYDFSNPEVANFGKLSNNYILNKDTGVLSFPATVLVPKGRIFGDYFYHTYYRLTNDGYGDLHFYGTGILVPASATESYTDWTYVDLKIVNEGTNQLNNGTLKFLARGYISSGSTVDTVLDNNRPWDVQEGTVAETVQRCGAKYSTSYSSLPEPTRRNAFNAKSSQSVSFGTLNSKACVYLRVFWCICNDENGTSWIDCTRGNKVFSAEMSGKYYTFTTGA